MSDNTYLTVPEAAGVLKMGASTLRHHIRVGTGPRVCKLGFLVRIRADDLDAWARGEATTVDHTEYHNHTGKPPAKMSKGQQRRRAIRA
jgi:excisionase family DNA binding protein